MKFDIKSRRRTMRPVSGFRARARSRTLGLNASIEAD
jgi:hypothetical protein